MIEACLALGLKGVHGIVAESQAYGRRTRGRWLDKGRGLVLRVPRTCTVCQDLEGWGHQHPVLPLSGEKSGRTKDEACRQWHGRSVSRPVEGESSDGRVTRRKRCALSWCMRANWCSSKPRPLPLPKSKQGQARLFAWEADAEAASAEYDGRDAEAATHAPGGIRQSTIVSWQKPGARAARGGDVQQRWTSHRLSRAIARWWQWRPSPTRRRTMGGRSWPRPCALR